MGLNVQIVVDCRDPDFLAGFWAAALGYEKRWSWHEATTQDMLEGGLEPERVNSRCAVIDPAGFEMSRTTLGHSQRSIGS